MQRQLDIAADVDKSFGPSRASQLSFHASNTSCLDRMIYPLKAVARVRIPSGQLGATQSKRCVCADQDRGLIPFGDLGGQPLNLDLGQEAGCLRPFAEHAPPLVGRAQPPHSPVATGVTLTADFVGEQPVPNSGSSA
jgi:hypothetical protein